MLIDYKYHIQLRHTVYELNYIFLQELGEEAAKSMASPL